MYTTTTKYLNIRYGININKYFHRFTLSTLLYWFIREFSDPPALSYEYPDLATLNAPSDLHVKYADAPEYNDPPGMSMKPGFGPTLVSNTSVTSQV